MSERKVLQKYYPPDFDPSALGRRRGPKQTGNRIQTVRLAAPFSMKCTTCGEFIGPGRKFNARKETPLNDRYLGIQIFYFHIKCTRCSGEIIFQTDPKNNDYAMVKGALRNTEPWRNREAEEETVEERLDRLEREEAEAAGEEERDAMADLEAKNVDARREMAAADALDEIRHRNARINRNEKDGLDYADAVVRPQDEVLARQEMEDEAAAKAAFAAAKARAAGGGSPEMSSQHANNGADGEKPAPPPGTDEALMPPPPKPVAAPAAEASSSVPSFKRVVKKKKDHSALLGIKKKPSLV